jgi:O-glycosyl hydrolase
VNISLYRSNGAVSFVVAAVLLAAAGGIVAQELSIGDDRQEVKGWGLVPGGFNREGVHQALCNMGITILRMPLDPHTGRPGGSIDASKLEGIKNDMRAARNYGVNDYYIVTWSPPPHMKLPEHVVEGTTNGGQKTYFNNAFTDEYVTYWINVLKNLEADIGLPVAVSMQNEPDFSPSCGVPCPWYGCNYALNGNTVNDYLTLVKKLRVRMDEENMEDVQIIGPEGVNAGSFPNFFGNDYQGLRNDTELFNALGALDYHHYGIEGQIVQTGHDFIAEYPEKDVWECEFSVLNAVWSDRSGGGGNDRIAYAINVMGSFGVCMVDLRTNYWFWWGGHNDWDGAYPTESLTYGPEAVPKTTVHYHCFKVLWSHVRPGWWVKTCTVTGDADLTTTGEANYSGWSPAYTNAFAFESPQRDSLFVTLLNRTGAQKSLTIMDVLTEETRIWVTDASRIVGETQATEVTENTITVSLPPHSITELLAKGTALAARPHAQKEFIPESFAAGVTESRVFYTIDGRRIGTAVPGRRGDGSLQAAGMFICRGEAHLRPVLVHSNR